MRATDDLYGRMQADGVCEYGESYEVWRRTWRQRALLNPPALLWALDFEWMTPAEVESWKAPEYWSEEHVLVPFASNGAGDSFAFYPRWGNAVVHAAHDFNESTALAPHLEGFLYRQMLEAFTYDYPERHRDFTASECERSLRANLQILRPYLRTEWISDLEEIASRAPKAWVETLPRTTERHFTRLDSTELARRISRELAFPYLNEVFHPMK